MGGTGLHVAFKPITERLPIVNATAGKNIVVDGDAIIHRALRSCNCKEIAHILWRDAGRVPDKLLQPLIKRYFIARSHVLLSQSHLSEVNDRSQVIHPFVPALSQRISLQITHPSLRGHLHPAIRRSAPPVPVGTFAI